jgi:hypothetical protein
MRRIATIIIIIAAAIASAITTVNCLSNSSKGTRTVVSFNRTPEYCRGISTPVCSGISENLSLISKEKLKTTYKSKITLVFTDIVASNSPDDVFLVMGRDEHLVILTNNDPKVYLGK